MGKFFKTASDLVISPTSNAPARSNVGKVRICSSFNNDIIMYLSSISRISTFCYDNKDHDEISSIESSDEDGKHDQQEKCEINRNSIKSKIKTKTTTKYETIWVIGGTQIYNSFMNNGEKTDIIIEEYYITYIDKDYECDTY